jgi:hypothetical protein
MAWSRPFAACPAVAWRGWRARMRPSRADRCPAAVSIAAPLRTTRCVDRSGALLPAPVAAQADPVPTRRSAWPAMWNGASPASVRRPPVATAAVWLSR